MKNKKILYTTLGMMICAFILTLTVFAGCGSDTGGVTNAGNLGNISNTPTATLTPTPITPTPVPNLTGYILDTSINSCGLYYYNSNL